MTDSFSPSGAAWWLGTDSRIGGYLVEERIASGERADVFRARDERLGRLAALKVLSPRLTGAPGFRTRFPEEYRLVAELDEPNILPVYGAGEEGGILYVAARFIPGGSLACLLEDDGELLEPGLVVSIVAQVAAALDAAHGAGLTHGGVGPGNILIDRARSRPVHAYLSDLGLSAAALSRTVTPAGTYQGLRGFRAAAEAEDGLPASDRADQYDLARVAAALMARTGPTLGGDRPGAWPGHLQGQPGPSHGLPGPAGAVLGKGTAGNPDERYPSCLAFAEALQEAVGAARPRPGGLAPGRRADSGLYAPAGPGPAAEPSVGVYDSQGVLIGPGTQTNTFNQKDGTYHGDITGDVTVQQDPAASGAWNRQPTGAGGGRPGGRRAVTAGWALAGLAVGAAAVFFAFPGPGGASSAADRPAAAAGGLVRVATFTAPGGGLISNVIDSYDFTLLAGQPATVSSRVYVWDMAERKYLTTLSLADDVKFQALGFSADDKELLVYSQPGAGRWKFYQFDLSTGQPSVLGEVPPSPLGYFADSIVGDTVATENSAGTRIDVTTIQGKAITSAGNPSRAPVIGDSIYLDDAASEFIFTNKAGQVYVIDIRSGRVLRIFHCAVSGDSAGTFPDISGDGLEVYCPGTSSRAGTLWDVATGADITPRDARWARAYDGHAVLSDGGGLLATQADSAAGVVDLWSALTGEHVQTLHFPAASGSMIWDISPDGREVLMGSWDSAAGSLKQLTLWDVP